MDDQQHDVFVEGVSLDCNCGQTAVIVQCSCGATLSDEERQLNLDDIVQMMWDHCE